MLSRNLEKTLRRALGLANARQHEYATLEHLLLALTDDRTPPPCSGPAPSRSTGCARDLTDFLDHDLSGLVDRRAGRRQADRRLPAGHPARRHPCPVLRAGRGDRRQRAGRAVLRAREPCGLLPARAEHDAARRGQLHQPRHRQGARPMSEQRRVQGADATPTSGERRGGEARAAAARTR